MNEGLGVAGVRIPASDFGDRPGNECLENLDIEVRQAALQAQYNHCDEVASEKCLSDATFVRRAAGHRVRLDASSARPNT